jgi:carbamoyl-phosphate synthase large subunit
LNTPSSGAVPREDEVRMRAHAVIRGLPITTTIDGMKAAVHGLEAMRDTRKMSTRTLQEYHVDTLKLDLKRVTLA